MISKQSLEILKQLAETEDCSIHWNSEYNIALDEVIKRLKELDKDNNDLRRLYRRTAMKLEEKGYEELAGYFLAQINEVPTFVVEDDIDYYEEYYKLKEKNRKAKEYVQNLRQYFSEDCQADFANIIELLEVGK